MRPAAYRPSPVLVALALATIAAALVNTGWPAWVVGGVGCYALALGLTGRG